MPNPARSEGSLLPSGRVHPLARPALSFERAPRGSALPFLVRGRSYAGTLGASELEVAPRSASGGPDTLTLRLRGADPGAGLRGSELQAGVHNRFLGRDPAHWRRGTRPLGRVTAAGVYPGVDVTYYGRDGELEFDFVVAPGADPGQIAIETDAELEIDAAGDVVIGGGFTLRRPRVYQDLGGVRHAVEARYRRHAGPGSVVGFEIAEYDPGHALVIDPILEFARHLGGDVLDIASDVALDSSGNLYVAGRTGSSDFPLPEGSDPNAVGGGGGAEAFVSKLAPDGTVLYTTLLGGSGDDHARAIEVDAEGNAYIAGTTPFFDTGFPTTPGAFRTTPASFFVAVLDPAGDLSYATFLGGANIGDLGGLGLHGSGADARVYLSGRSQAGHPTTPDAYQTSPSGLSAGFLTILEPAQAVPADQLVYSTYLDGVYATDVAAGPDGRAYLTGDADTGAVLRNAFDSEAAGGGEAYLGVLDPNTPGDASLVYASFIGGSGFENQGAGLGGIAVSPSGVALVTGYTGSFDFPVTPEGARVTRELGDAFFVAVDPSRSGSASLLYGSYVGGTKADSGTAVAAGEEGIAYVVGATDSADIPDGDGGVAEIFGVRGFQDAFVVKVDWRRSGPASIVDAALVTGSQSDIPHGVAADTTGNVAIAGQTSSGAPFGDAPAPADSDGFVALLRSVIALPAGRVGTPSADVLAAGSGTPPYSWALSAGSLPPGLSLESDGTLAGTPSAVGSHSFTVEITDAASDVFVQRYRKRIGEGGEPGDLIIRKAGSVPVPGRTFPYYILVRNRSDKTFYDVGVVELLEAWFGFVSSTPAPTLLEPHPGHVYWTIPEIGPGEFEVIQYMVSLPPDFPTGVIVEGNACLDESDCSEEQEQCLRDGKEFCENTLCVGNGSGANCIGCHTDEKARCYKAWIDCIGKVGGSNGQNLNPEEGTTGGGCNTHSGPTRGPLDPNEKVSASRPFVPPGEVLGFTVHFENIGDLEAIDVFIDDVLDEDLDLDTVQVFERGGALLPLAPDSTVPLYANGDEVWTASLDSATRTLSFELLGIDLAPEATDSVFFVVQAPEALASGTEIRNEASIQFEVLAPIVTNETLNTVDSTPPSCTMSPLPPTTAGPDIALEWTSEDAIGEVMERFLYVSEDGGPFEYLAVELDDAGLVFEGEPGRSYGFFCAARDTAGNAEGQALVAEVSTTAGAGGGADCPPTPEASCIAAGKAKLSINERRAGREKLAASLSKLGALVTQTDLGDPVTGTTRYDLCLYDADDALVGGLGVDRAGATCGPRNKPCWKALGTRGYRYSDPDLGAAGVRKLVAKGGDPGRGKLTLRAANHPKRGGAALPGLAGVLDGHDELTLQLLVSDGTCAEVLLDEVRRADGVRFKAVAR